MRAAAAALLLAVAAYACGPRSPRAAATPPHRTQADGAGSPRTCTIFYAAEVRGTPEPCGCSSDPRGGLSRLVEAVKQARAAAADPTSVLFVDAGGLLYDPDRFSPDRAPEARIKADFAVAAERAASVAAVGLGYEDLLDGAGRLRLAREAANVRAPAEIPGVGALAAAPVVIEAGGVEVGLFGVADPDAVSGYGVTASSPEEAARAAVADLRRRGAEVIVALLPLSRAQAARLLEKVPGIDFGVVGKDLDDHGLPVAEPAGAGFLLVGANRGQAFGRIDVTLRGGRADGAPRFVDAGGAAAAEAEIARLGERRSRVAAQVAELDAMKGADPAYVKTKHDELASIDAELAGWRARPLRVPAAGPYFVDALVPVRRKLDCDPQVEAAKVAMDRAIGELNAKATDPVAPAPPGVRRYVGMAACASCHEKEVAFWRTTVHAHAWQALVDKGKQLDRDCIGCHVTGWHEPGGAAFSRTADLENVQCEICHGPGSAHVDALEPAEFRSTITRDPGTTRCLACHTPEQSDTFAGNEQAYLRDITGPGHGAALHAKLGPGPRAHELRAAALAKAGLEVGRNCR